MQHRQKQYREELWKRLESLGICFVLIISAIAIANAWNAMAVASGLQPAGTTDANTTAIRAFIVGIINWVAGFASIMLALGLVMTGIQHHRETDPQKRD